jgi:hypothetical protein
MLRLASFSVREPAQFATVVRKAYGVTSGLRLGVARTRAGTAGALVHDGSDAGIVDNNLSVVRQLIAPASSAFDAVAWTAPAPQQLSADDARVEAARLLERIGLS